MQKACIVETTTEAAPYLKTHLPFGVFVADERLVDKGMQIVAFRLEGEGLLEWCRVGSDSPEIAVSAMAGVMADGNIGLVPRLGCLRHCLPLCRDE